jgi:hypothetical protein
MATRRRVFTPHTFDRRGWQELLDFHYEPIQTRSATPETTNFNSLIIKAARFEGRSRWSFQFYLVTPVSYQDFTRTCKGRCYINNCMKKSQLRKQSKFYFQPAELQKLEEAAKFENLALSVWGRQILLEAAERLDAARKEVARASNWRRLLDSKKLLNERELQQ